MATRSRRLEGIQDQRDDVNLLDENSPHFDCEAYLAKILKEQKLIELIEKDKRVTQEIRSLDQEKQQLVYENYNKFITATDTIRKMNQDFVLMEEEMGRLADSMNNISELSKTVGNSLKDRRQDVQRLAKASGTLKQLESVFNLPQTLQNYLQQKEYNGAVRAYLKARPVLERHKNEPSFRRIYGECVQALVEIKDQLKDSFRNPTSTNKELANSVALLLQLEERPEDLADEFIRSADERLQKELETLETLTGVNDEQAASDFTCTSSGDILEFVDVECSNFLSNLSLMIHSGRELFPRFGDALMEAPIDALMRRFLSCVERRFCSESDPIGEGDLLVRALDRFYRKLHAANQLLALGGDRYESLAKELTSRVAMRRVDVTAKQLETVLDNAFMDMRQRIASVRNVGMTMGLSLGVGQSEGHAGSGASGTSENANKPLAETLTRFEQTLKHGLKSALAHLLQMTAGSDLTFVAVNGPQFLAVYSKAVRELVVGRYFQRFAASCDRLCSTSVGGSSGGTSGGSSLLLVAAKACQNMATSTVGYFMNLCEQQLLVGLNYHSTPLHQREKTPTETTSSDTSAVIELMKDTGRKLLEEFVAAEGFGISQMIVKSIETRDWLGGLEPRSIRPVMKRVDEDLKAIDWRVAQLFEEGTRRDRSSDSSRRTSILAGVSSRSQHGLNTPNISQRLQLPATGAVDSTVAALSKKIWTDRIDFVANVSFTRVSIMTSVIKICLKTFLESVRLRTFGKFGLQYVQIDCRYLQLQLWRFVSDENIISTLLEEILTSATKRCIEPVLMEPSVVNSICERC